MLLTRAKTTAGTRAASNVCQFTGIAGESGMRLFRAVLAVVSDRTHTDNEAGHPNWAGHPPAVMWNGWKQSAPPDEIMGRIHPTVTFSARPVVQETPAQPETRVVGWLWPDVW